MVTKKEVAALEEIAKIAHPLPEIKVTTLLPFKELTEESDLLFEDKCTHEEVKDINYQYPFCRKKKVLAIEDYSKWAGKLAHQELVKFHVQENQFKDAQARVSNRR